MATVWKYVLPVGDQVSVEMPRDALVLSVQAQGDDLCLWALVNPDEPRITRAFIILGTGHPTYHYPDELRHVGTAQMGPLVWHVFEPA